MSALGHSTQIVETSSFDPVVSVPIDGENLGSADLVTILQPLANRSRYLLNALANQAYAVRRFDGTVYPWTAIGSATGYIAIPLPQPPLFGDRVEVSLNIQCASGSSLQSASAGLGFAAIPPPALLGGLGLVVANAVSQSGLNPTCTLVGQLYVNNAGFDTLYILTTSSSVASSPILGAFGSIKLLSN